MSLNQDAVKKHLISVADFHAMDNVGLFPESPKVELINGEIFDMAPIGPAHGSVVKQLTERFVLAASKQAIGHNIQEYWLVDIPNRQLLVFKEPADDSYKQQVTLRSPTVLSPDALPDIEIDMSGLF